MKTRVLNTLRRPGFALAAFAATFAAPLLALASPPHGGEDTTGAAGDHLTGPDAHGIHENEFKWIGDGFLGGPGDDGRTGFLIVLVNFFVLMWILNKILFKNLRASNAEASDAVRLELERATKARSEAEALVKEYEAKLEALEAEVAEIREKAVSAAEAEHERILEEAREQAEKIKEAALRAGEREAARRRAELENEIVDQALAKAEAAIRSSFGGPDQRRLVDAWVDEVSATKLGDEHTGVN